MSLRSRIFRYESRKRDLGAELDAHLRMAVADRMARGETPEEARAAALRDLGSVPLIEDVTRETWGWLWLERLLQDLGYAFRQMRRSPGFAATVIGTLALGIGAAAGTGLAWVTARFVRGYLYGVSMHDGWTLAGAAALLCASGLLAAYIPARRAAKVDPIVALRTE